MVDDVVFNKVAIIERCLRRIQEEYQQCRAIFTRRPIYVLAFNIKRVGNLLPLL